MVSSHPECGEPRYESSRCALQKDAHVGNQQLQVALDSGSRILSGAPAVAIELSRRDFEGGQPQTLAGITCDMDRGVAHHVV